MYKRKILVSLLAFFVFTGLLFGQYNQKDVMLNQIRRLEARREFNQALQLYQDLLESYPDDETVITGYYNILLNLNKVEEAGQVLDEYEHIFAVDAYVQHRIRFLIRNGEQSQARRLGLDFLRDNPNVVNHYRNLARVFERERQAEVATEILILARQTTNDDYLFAIELARNYEQKSNYSASIAEYIKHLERNPGFLNFVNSRIKTILDADVTQIETLENLLSSADNDLLLELYALSLAHIEDYEEAFLIYRELDPEKLHRFADELLAAGNVDLARQAYEKYRLSINDPLKSADVGIKMAQLHISEHELLLARDILSEIRDDERLHDRQVRFRTRANQRARELLADIAIRFDETPENVIDYFEQAKSFAFNRNEQKEVDLRLAHYMIMSEDYSRARNILESTLRGEPSGSHVTNMSHYYKFMLELMESMEPSDSLLTEMIIGMPGTELTSEALFLTVIFHEMNPQVREAFLDAYRLKSVYKDREAVNRLLELDDNLLDEEIILISGQWALEANDFELAENLFAHEFRNETLAGYAVLKLAELREKVNAPYRETVTTFLTEYPTHVFSPKLRLLLGSGMTSTSEDIN